MIAALHPRVESPIVSSCCSATLALAAWGQMGGAAHAARRNPDLSDVQVIIRTTYPGQARQGRREPDHLSAHHDDALLPGAKTVRGYSFFGDSFVYILFEDGTIPTGRARGCSNT